jgi:hypothetical protein
LSSALLYLAIVAIWAFFLVPRWLRRPHLLGGENTDHDGMRPDESAPGRDGEETDGEPDADREPAPASREGRRRMAALPASRSKVLQARRRMLTVLITLMIMAAVCTYLKLTSWLMCLPPVGMLGLYLLLLREAALADAERARGRAAEEHRAQATRQRARAGQPDDSAQVIDISARLGDQLYDQYEDATMRAVGD